MTTAEKMISDEELDSLTTAIKQRYGIDFTNYERKSLKRGFSRLVMRNQWDSILPLWSKIMSDRDFFTGCIDELTVNLTELFRNPEIWIKMKEEILPQYSLKSSLKMWHAGCSSGEEVYTMAIVLKSLNMLRRTQTLGTDLSATILEQAKEAKYSNVLMNKYLTSFSKFLPNGDLKQSFEFGEKYAVVKPDLKRHVTYERHNLVQDKMDQTFDMIFCRNVMIYFDDGLKMKVLKLFHESLADDGYFVIGYYDMLPPESKELFKVYDSKTRIYKKVL
ncbi:protein-glutamate O-methyltransferase CheR [Paracrocinitomix mangrovi]|uniref:CheR family methyltransferase n=1 Tax=Paracrocinitomix mangrovi TaxID=2862509 RepID=UPI001C8D2099|nr:protein-glutamate O-methyltransferase CheR [Paracrocinitomix mangrovi]UKN01606.1 protein-glutamate O-methyltransferase CheR [Paracrocinitomix mangrovi]